MSIHNRVPIWFHALTNLAKAKKIELIGQSDPRYDSARLIFNRYHDLFPAAIVRTKQPSSVGSIIRFAVDHDLPLAIRGGGHHIAGYGSCEGGIVIDFSQYREVSVDISTRIAEVEPGARLGDVDQKLCAMGLVIPTGTVSETGIAGLTLGGGIGWLVGRYGLTCDQLIGADVVLADGTIVRAEDKDHEDLLWALRGGGGNFGVVTSFRFRTHDLPQCTIGSGIVTFENASAALRRTIDYLVHANDRNLTVAPSLIYNKMGKPILSIDFCLAGCDYNALYAFKTAVGPADWSIQQNADYVTWQKSFDNIFHLPMRGYWKAKYSNELHQVDIETLIEAYKNAPTQQTSILIEHLHGAFNDTGLDSAAFPLRWAKFGILLSVRWTDPAFDSDCIRWVRESFNQLDPKGTSATYSNYTAHDDSRALSTFSSSAVQRLVNTKKRYDPSNVFCRNHNIIQ